MPDVPPPGLSSLPALRFLLQFSDSGGANFGATGMSEAVTTDLQAARLVDVYNYKPLNTQRGRGGVTVVRRYRAVCRGSLTPAFAAHFREALRGRNLPAISNLSDGHGRVAFNQAWRERRIDIIAAACEAWRKTT